VGQARVSERRPTGSGYNLGAYNLTFRSATMPDYRRNYVPGGTYFFTCRRAPILTTDLGRKCLREALDEVRANHPFAITAIVLLPDHWHTVWTLPPGDDRYPLRWMRIKEEFTERWLDGGGQEQS
jgi:putative transposase